MSDVRQVEGERVERVEHKPPGKKIKEGRGEGE
jgi:hypothetical protein